MAIENTVYRIFDPRSSIVKSVYDCRLSGVTRASLNLVQVIRRHLHSWQSLKYFPASEASTLIHLSDIYRLVAETV